MNIMGFDVPVWLLLVLLMVFIIHRHLTSTFSTFKKMGISGPSPWTLGGNNIDILRHGLQDFDILVSKKYGKMVGTFDGRRPVLLVSDPEMLRQITVNHFSSFRNRDSKSFKADYPMSQTLLAITGDHWKRVRGLISPTFSGSKLREMIPLINRCGRNLVRNLNVTHQAGDIFECKEYTGSFTMDVIASTAFSLDIDTKNDKNNPFVRMANDTFDVNLFNPKVFLLLIFPFMKKVLRQKSFGFTLFDSESVRFFENALQKSISDREDHGEQVRKDFLHMMLSARTEDLTSGKGSSGKQTGLTYEEMFSNALIFFLAGYNTTADTLSQVMYNLAIYPEEQDKVYSEICKVLGDKAEPDYDDMKKMSYMQMFIDESMRLFTPAPRFDRVAEEDVTICGVNIPKGMIIGIPAHVLHNDPDTWQDPETFNPQRFSAEAKQTRHPFQYMPFGLGPRNCIAQRLAHLELKMALVHMLKAYKLVTCQQTQIPLRISKLKVERKKGIWLKVEPRQ